MISSTHSLRKYQSTAIERAEVQRDVEREPRILPPEEQRREREMGGARDGKELGEALDESEYDRLKFRHVDQFASEM